MADGQAASPSTVPPIWPIWFASNTGLARRQSDDPTTESMANLAELAKLAKLA